jgi:predicted metal-dependent hydrolase
MQVRTPQLNFPDHPAHWAPNKEFAQSVNGQSILPAHIEPYLVKVMVKAKAKLDPKEAALHRKLDIFIKQEMQHCRQHIAFNRKLRESGYEGLAEIEAEYAADYDRFLSTKSLRWNLAYSEGFEAMSAIGVTTFFEEYDEFLDGADQSVVDLWKWHLAEEYEHREVAHDVLHKLVGLNPLSAYVFRVHGFLYALKHIGGYGRRMSHYLLAKDRETMSAEEVEASRLRMRHVAEVSKRRAREHLIEIMSPFYRPGKRKPPKGWAAFLARFDPAPVT